MRERNKIKFANIFNDGCDELSFVLVEERGKNKIGFALKSKNGESHEEIYQIGTELGFFSGDIEPSGGGVFDARTSEYIRPSFNYGEVDEEILEAIFKKIPNYNDC